MIYSWFILVRWGYNKYCAVIAGSYFIKLGTVVTSDLVA
jgi:hypothetical protein